jgi:hypothetical protein
MSAKGRCKASQSKELTFEPIIGYKHPIIASGVTLIGSTGRAPDRIVAKWKFFMQDEDYD